MDRRYPRKGAEGSTKWWEKLRTLEGPGTPLCRLGHALEAVKAKLETKKGLDKALSALKWPFEEKEVEMLISTIQREKSLLQLALTNDCRQLIKRIKESSTENRKLLEELIQTIRDKSMEDEMQFEKLNILLEEIQDELKGGVGELREQRVNSERQIVLDWITPIDYTAQQNDHFSRRQAETGRWLLDSTEYQAWLKTEGQTLFCPGIPGAGKTILTSVVIEDVASRFRNDATVGIAYLYCNFRRRDKEKAKDLFANLLKQLSKGRTSLPDTVKTLYNDHRGKETRPSFEEVLRALQSVIALYLRVFIIVDALDEAPYEERDEFLAATFNLQQRTQARVNVFATSRPAVAPHFKEHFEEHMSKEVRAADNDVLTYINGRLSTVRRPRLSKYPDLQDAVRREVVNAADGMFLPAELHLDHLFSKRTPGDLEDALKDLPRGISGLNTLYDQAMERINSQNEGPRETANEVLSWIIHAKRPLNTVELQHAIAVRDKDVELKAKYLPEVEDLISDCAGLVTIDNETDVAFETGVCPTDEEFEERLQSNKLYDYAAHNWGHHARESLTLCSEVINFLDCEVKLEAASQALMAIKRHSSHSNYSQKFPRQMTGLHLAAYFGIEEAVKALLEKRVETDAMDTYGMTPLSYAAGNGYETVVKLLIEKGAKLESKCNNSRTPLSYAARNGHEAVVKLLLEKGAKLESKSNYGSWTPLSYAARNGHDAVVELLLAKGAELESRDNYGGRTPLLYAAKNGHEAVVKLLLAKGAKMQFG
ncbi:hypothetical protein DL771_007500 [Monosporascus sp. 5C6A]|nr:hypothetical protein DL771_007500 [Monosporascus sp. 5C6A]